jgi:hypothetical protein
MRDTGRVVALSLVRLASVAGNVALLRSRGRSEGGPVGVEPPPSVRAGAPRLAPPGLVALESCPLELEERRRFVAALRGRLEDSVPFRQAFDRAPVSSAATAEVRSALDRIGGDGLRAECRADVCRIIPAGTRPLEPSTWQKLFADPELRPRRGRASVGAADVWFRHLPRETVRGQTMLGPLVTLAADPDLARGCRAHVRDRGRLVVRIDLQPPPAAGRFAFYPGGKVALTPGGDCLLEKLKAAAAQLAVPDNVTEGSRVVEIIL